MNKALPLLLAINFSLFTACEEAQEHTAPPIYDRDSVSMMVSYGVNTLISDSGIIKYKIVTERWEVNENVNPKRWIFRRGLFLEQFDEKFHVEAYIQADTAYCYTEQNLWHLIGNVRVRTVDGLVYSSEELYWDQNKHELYSYRFSHLVTPEREMQGAYFRSDEQLRRYFISNSKGSFMQSDMFKEDTTTQKAASDTSAIVPPKRGMTMPRKKNNN